MTDQLPPFPSLPPGHRPMGNQATAKRLDYWEALDDRGYAYRVGWGHYRAKDGIYHKQQTNAWGVKRTWQRADDNKDWTETTQSASTWRLPDGSTLKFSGNFEPRMHQAKQFVPEYQRGGRHSWWLNGETGRGKTVIARWIIAEARMNSIDAIETTWLDLCAGVSLSFGSEARQRWEAQLERMLTIPLLMLDDIAPPKDDREKDLLLRIIDARTEAQPKQLPTIVTCNHTTSDFDYEPRLASRLARFDLIGLTGPDHRRRK